MIPHQGEQYTFLPGRYVTSCYDTWKRWNILSTIFATNAFIRWKRLGLEKDKVLKLHELCSKISEFGCAYPSVFNRKRLQCNIAVCKGRIWFLNQTNNLNEGVETFSYLKLNSNNYIAKGRNGLQTQNKMMLPIPDINTGFKMVNTIKSNFIMNSL